MIDAILTRRKLAIRLTVKGAIALLSIALAVALPQFVHLAGGREGGQTLLPMYAPVLLAGCLLGWQFGLGVGVLAPLASYAFTAWLLQDPMPAQALLPYLCAELAVFGLVSGLFAEKLARNPLLAFPAVAVAEIAGRTLFLVLRVAFGAPLAAVWTAIEAGLLGLYLQLVLVPCAVLLLSLALRHDKA